MTKLAKRQPVSYVDQLDQRDPASVSLVVIHCTELPDLATARDYAERPIYDSGAGNCGHYYVDRDGRRYEYVPAERIAHHVRNHNQSSVGIELINSGRFPNWHDSTHQTLTEPYSAVQIDSLIELLAGLCETLPGLREIAGHEDLDTAMIPATDQPNLMIRRKVDPGPLFPWETVLGRVPLRRRF